MSLTVSRLYSVTMFWATSGVLESLIMMTLALVSVHPDCCAHCASASQKVFTSFPSLPFPWHWTWMWVVQLLHARSWFHLTWCNLGHSLGRLVHERGQKARAAGHVSPVVMVVRSCRSCWASMMIGWFWAHCLWALVLTILVGDYWICGGSNRGAIAHRKHEQL
jgi:hypothetical protein